MGEEITITTNINSTNGYTIQNIALTSSSIIYIDWGDNNIEEASTNANFSHTLIKQLCQFMTKMIMKYSISGIHLLKI